jgi:hypothetical protein
MEKFGSTETSVLTRDTERKSQKTAFFINWSFQEKVFGRFVATAAGDVPNHLRSLELLTKRDGMPNTALKYRAVQYYFSPYANYTDNAAAACR